jgi:hypothetical protein
VGKFQAQVRRASTEELVVSVSRAVLDGRGILYGTRLTCRSSSQVTASLMRWNETWRRFWSKSGDWLRTVLS